MNPLLFWSCAVVAVIAAGFVISRRSARASALALAVSVVALAALFAGLSAPFLFIIQILVYAGAVVVFIIFVIMLLNLGEEETRGRLVSRGKLSLERFAALFSSGPAKAFRLPGGTLAVGAPADVTLFDPQARWKVDPNRFLSKGRSTPFSGWELVGGPAGTIVAGTVVWQRVDL